jgi:hypothetical protein
MNIPADTAIWLLIPDNTVPALSPTYEACPSRYSLTEHKYMKQCYLMAASTKVSRSTTIPMHDHPADRGRFQLSNRVCLDALIHDRYPNTRVLPPCIIDRGLLQYAQTKTDANDPISALSPIAADFPNLSLMSKSKPTRHPSPQTSHNKSQRDFPPHNRMPKTLI